MKDLDKIEDADAIFVNTYLSRYTNSSTATGGFSLKERKIFAIGDVWRSEERADEVEHA